MSNCPPEQVLHMKTGTSAIFKMAYHDDSDPVVPLSLAGYTIFMKIIHPKTRLVLFDGSIDNGILVIDEVNGLYVVNAGDTSNWPLGEIPVDIRYVNTGVTKYTETFYLEMGQGLS